MENIYTVSSFEREKEKIRKLKQKFPNFYQYCTCCYSGVVEITEIWKRECEHIRLIEDYETYPSPDYDGFSKENTKRR